MHVNHRGRPPSRVALLLCLCLAGCASAMIPPFPQLSTITPAPAQPTAAATARPYPSATATPALPALPSLYFAPGVPAGLQARVRQTLGPGYVETGEPEAAVRVLPGAPLGHGYTLAENLYVPAVAFPTLDDGVTWADIQAFWQGRPETLRYVADNAGTPTLFVDADTYTALWTLLGKPAPDLPIQTVPAAELAARVWAARPLSWALVPFDGLQPSLKALTVDGQSTLSKRLAMGPYPLRTTYTLVAAPDVAATLDVQEGPWLNRDPERMTVLMMTGVTALGRATAWKMELNGVLYPALKVRDILLDHDLLHISNEVSFAQDCPYPNPAGDTTFCASPRYVELLRDIGVDLVELSGNHNEDWGPAAATLSLEMYAKEGWPHFAGGWDDVDATTPLTVTDHGNTFVFLGCNPVGPFYAWAAPGHPGAAACDYPRMTEQIRQARAAGALPIVTWQYFEIYDYAATPDEVRDFRMMADAGAVVVSGSQAHHPQAFDLYGGAFVHYGLGNLFFDQMDLLGTRQEFADQYVFYDGRLLSTRLFTFMLEDYAQPRPMTPNERAALLQTVFRASGW